MAGIMRMTSGSASVSKKIFFCRVGNGAPLLAARFVRHFVVQHASSVAALLQLIGDGELPSRKRHQVIAVLSFATVPPCKSISFSCLSLV